ncbi:hypothetical protein G6F46_003564 [Rhizopus delemar]|uniref:ATP-dependent DNA helicase n=3 Tax=Rhizopus TaxID=4842 RepID=I1C6M4_RHIO9|nr:hypothetical protein RO3G_08814 [Rhizopus delemar RA 99-880]KAG1453432.1 hypothetical protein G6F55_008141 [Rhizopus delemar]KAG1540698.1 hypothetical protein G6F51_008362 [Rhizopus arrhizus]KAG1493290.1 hypothetical protein G6F54_008681 [Rhizopus delemar]KAG1509999.1 hypothetical protein G6F53_007017 [Rhizopus delemar]|eukprot:EIE84104.1 hypothetical protein RO3G_08814 [Rhizopus delemar RA 99-880]
MLEDQRTTAQQHFQYLYAQCSDEQKNVFETIMNTPFKLFRVLGSAGTGFRDHDCYTCPTGIAAYTVGGQTIHRFFGLANTNQVSNCVRLTDFFKRHPKMALLIDEFSMISAQLLQTMSTQLSIVTDCNRPFGNLLTIFFGDIGQLPPIDHATAGHCFMSPLWNAFCYFYLKKQQRQSGVDQQMFTNVLAQIRMNNYPHYVRDFINERKRLDEDIPFHALRLFTTRNKVDQYNKHKIRLASGRLFTFPSTDVGSEPALKDTALPSVLHVKIGAPVLLLDNLDVSNGWTNGTQCIIEDVDDDIIYIKRVTDSVIRGIKPITREVYKTNYYRKQYPIVLAFASTIHKVQSLTVEAVAVSLLEPFLSHGELYVACSRVKSADNLFFLGTHQINLQVGFDTAVLDALDDSDDLFK